MILTLNSKRIAIVKLLAVVVSFAMMTAVAAAGCARQLAEKPFVIAERGKSYGCMVVVPASPSPCITNAASELVKYVEKMTGVRLEVVSEPVAVKGYAVALGETSIATAVLGESGALPHGSFRTVVRDGRLIVRGGDDRGVLFGVYDLLENQFDCEWLAPDFEIVPERGLLSVTNGFDVTQKPAFVGRDTTWRDVLRNPDFAAKLKIDGFFCRDLYVERHGGPYLAFDPVLKIAHSFFNILPPEKYFRDHPEYYSEVGGRRVASRNGKQGQLCLSNPDVVRLSAEFVLKRIAAGYPAIKYYGVSQMDWRDPCQCENCRAIDEREGSPMGSVLAFVNAIAAEVAKKYPDVWIQTLAYRYTLVPPRHIKPRENVMIQFCTDACDHSKPLAESRYAKNVEFVENLSKWRRIANRLATWDYTCNFRFIWHAFPDVKAIAGDIRLFHDIGVNYCLEEGNQGTHGDLSELKQWLIGHLLWNPEQPLEPLLDRFFTGFYGAGAPWARRYFEELHALPRDEEKEPIKMWGTFNSPSLPTEFFERAAGWWHQAAEAVKGDAARERNVEWALNATDYTRIMRSNWGAQYECTAHPEYVRSARFAELQQAARRIVKALDDDPILAGRKKKMPGQEEEALHAERRIRYLAALDPMSVKASDSVVVEADSLAFASDGGALKVVQDSNAMNGAAVRFSDAAISSQLKLRLDSVHCDPDARYKLRFRLKVERKTDAPKDIWAFCAERIDLELGGAPVRKFTNGDPSGDYQWYEMDAPWTPTPSQQIIFRLGGFGNRGFKNHPVVKFAYLDRIEIVRCDR
ncbi:MAG: DUF4838 domain-containing protein [Kiritimatiellae bacterium]|nr:DUF4838 domain-containing protein [Kiritimatiellia bacterium]